MFRALTLRYRGAAPGEAFDADGAEQDTLLDEEENDDDEELAHDPSCLAQKQNIPWKGILLAIILSLVGSLMLATYILSLLSVITFQPANSITFLLLAFITLIPGVYHCVIAIRALRGDEGYSLDDIADLN